MNKKHPDTPCKLRQRFEIVKSKIGADLRLDLSTGAIEFRGEVLHPRFFRLFLATELDLDVPAHDAASILRVLAAEHPYDPGESPPPPSPEPESQPEPGGWGRLIDVCNRLEQKMENSQ